MLQENDFYLLLFQIANRYTPVTFAKISRITAISGGTLNAYKDRLFHHQLLDVLDKPILENCKTLFQSNLHILYPISPVFSSAGIALHSDTESLHQSNFILPWNITISNISTKTGLTLGMKKNDFLRLIAISNEYWLWISLFQLARLSDPTVHTAAISKIQSLLIATEHDNSADQHEPEVTETIFDRNKHRLVALAEKVVDQLENRSKQFVFTLLYTRLHNHNRLTLPGSTFVMQLTDAQQGEKLGETISQLEMEFSDKKMLSQLIDEFRRIL